MISEQITKESKCSVPSPFEELLDKPLPNKTSSAISLMRRWYQKFIPLKARVRFDVNKNMWAVLKEDNSPLRHFSHGHLENAKLSSIKVETHVGCGGRKTTYIGIAEGLLRENTYSPNLVGLSNLSFADGEFIDSSNQTISFAAEIQLMPNRHALYK